MKRRLSEIWNKNLPFGQNLSGFASKTLYGGIVFVLLILPLTSHAQAEKYDPYRVRIDFTLRPLIEIATAPFRFLAFVKNTIDEQGRDISQKSLSLLRAPYTLTKAVNEQINKKSALLADLLEPQDNPRKSDLTSIVSIAKEKILSSLLGISSLLDRGPAGSRTPEVLVSSQTSDYPGPTADVSYQNEDDKSTVTPPEPQRIIVREKEIIHEIVTRIDADSNAEKRGSDIGDKLTALRSELTDSFAKRINTLVGGFGFSTNRFDDLFVQKSLELAGKLNQPPAVASSPITFSSSITSKDISATSLSLSSTLTVSGSATSTIKGPLVAGSGNVQIIDSSGRIPALSSTYFASLPGIFASIGNASSTVQFSASSTSDVLSFEGTGGITISFDSINKKIVFASTNPTLLSVLQQGADASTFTGTTKIAGLTLTSAGNLTLAGTFAVQGNATSTIENNLWVKGLLKVGATSLTLTDTGISSTGNLTLSPTGTFTISTTATSTIAGPLVAGSGNVRIIDETGKVPALSSTYFANLSGANLASLNADNISSGTLAVARGGTGTGTAFTQGSIVFAGAGGIYSQNNAKLFWDDTNLRLGIGTASPSGTLHISNASSTNALIVNSSGNITIGTAGPALQLTNADNQILIGTTTDPGWTVPAVQVRNTAAFFSSTAGAGITINNAYFDGSYKYTTTAAASRILHDTDGTISLQNAPSGTAGNAVTWTQAIKTADPGLVAIGRSAVTDSGSIIMVGLDGTSNYDLTSATAATTLTGLNVAPSLRMQANHSTHRALMVRANISADGTARTVTDLRLLTLSDPSVASLATATNLAGMFITGMTGGGTTNRLIDTASGALLTTGGVWTNASSREYKDVLRRNTPEDYPTRIGELRALDPVYYRHTPDHLIHPLRTQEDLEKYNKENNKNYQTLDQANAAGIATDARFNEAIGEYEAYRFGRWEKVWASHS